MSEPIAFTPAMKIERYIALRDKIDAMENDFQKAIEPYVAGMKAIEASLQGDLNDAGADNIKTPAGTVYRSTHHSTKVTDWEQFLRFVQETGEWQLLVHGAAKKEVREYAEEHQGVKPPGVEMSSVMIVHIRRS